MGLSYCKDLNFQQQQEQVVVDGRYIDYDCVLPIGSTYVILVAQVRCTINTLDRKALRACV